MVMSRRVMLDHLTPKSYTKHTLLKEEVIEGMSAGIGPNVKIVAWSIDAGTPPVCGLTWLSTRKHMITLDTSTAHGGVLMELPSLNCIR